MRRPIPASRALRGLLAVVATAAAMPAAAIARQGGGESPAPLPEAVVDRARAGAPASGGASRPPRAVAAVEGLASPGLRVTLRGDGSEGDSLEYRWIQTWGPEVALDDPGAPNQALVVPRAAGTMVFVLLVRNAEGVDSATVHVPIRWGGRDPSPPGLVADAGDDLAAAVGRQVTLNGIRSTPSGEVGYRWIQVDGPPVALAIEDGYVFTFVPEAAGTYRFALVVASGNAISAPDYVRVDVGGGPTPALAASGSALAAPAPAAPASAVSPIEVFAASAMRGIEGGGALARPMADAFEGVAGRMDLYPAPDAAFRELALRIDAALPADPSARARWESQVFRPLSAAMIADLGARGLDLARAGALASDFSPSGRSALADGLRRVADGFRSVATAGPIGGAGATAAGAPNIDIDRTSASAEQGRGIR